MSCILNLVDVCEDAIIGLSGKTRATANGPNLMVQNGDRVHVGALPTKLPNVVTPVGAVTNPGHYDSKFGMGLHDLLEPDQLTVDPYLDSA